MFKIDKSVLNLKVGKWSHGRVGSPFATFRKLTAATAGTSPGTSPGSSESPEKAGRSRPLNRDVCALLEEAAFITGDRLGVKRRRVSKH